MQIQDPYAKYKEYSKIAYRILEVLMKDEKAEELWKLLKYNEPDAWKRPNLSLDEKASLISNTKLLDDLGSHGLILLFNY